MWSRGFGLCYDLLVLHESRQASTNSQELWGEKQEEAKVGWVMNMEGRYLDTSSPLIWG